MSAHLFRSFVAFIAAALMSVAAFAAPPQLVGSNAPQADGVSRDQGVVRSRFVNLNLAALDQVQADLAGTPGTPRELAVDFFGDASFIILVNRTEIMGPRVTAFYGSVAGLPFSSATIVKTGDAVAVNVQMLGKTFQIRYRGEAGHEVRESDPSVFVDHGAQPIEINGPVTRKSDVEVAADDGSLIDVLVAYTTAAATSQGGTVAMQSLINLAIAETNDAYASAGVIQRLRLVHSVEVAYTEVDMSTDLGRLQATADGFLDNVHTLRNTYGADLVSMIGNYTEACGLGYLMSTESASFAANGFNVVARTCATGNYSFGHELGHNMGLRHDPFVDTGTNTINGSAGQTYAHGYVDLTNHVRTVMAYNDQCAAQVPTFNCTRMKIFSTPSANITSPFNGAVAPAGNASNSNNALALNNTRDTVANFRTAIPSGGSLNFSAPGYSIGEAGGTVQLTVTRAGGTLGAASVQYATSNGTATAGQDYTTTSGTLNWANGEAGDKFINVPILQDAVSEPNETFTVTLSSATGAAIGSPTATVTIQDDELSAFPPGCVMPAGWVQPGTAAAGWSVAMDQTFEGPCSLKSNAIGNGQRAEIQVTGTFVAGNITFRRRVHSEAGWDFFRFYVDGVEQGPTCAEGNSACSGGTVTGATATGTPPDTASGPTEWTQPSGVLSFPVTAGSHTVTFSYQKDSQCCSQGADAAWIDAVVLPIPQLLTVAKAGTGAGTVASAPAGINCGADCTENYSWGTIVTLTATPSAGSVFAGWSGGGCSGTGTCQVLMSAATNVTATFTALVVYNLVLEGWQQSPYVVTAASGSGTATFNPISKQLTFNLTYSGLSSAETMAHIHGPAGRGANAGVLIDLTLGSPKTNVVVLTPTQESQLSAGNLYVNIHTAIFGSGELRAQIDNLGATPTFGLTVTRNGAGTGSVTSAPAGINCGADCNETYPSGTSVVLTAAPGAGSAVGSWTGCNSTAGNQCTVTMSSAKAVTVSFVKDDPALPDFNADNKPDLLWRHVPSGSLYIWYMNGLSLISDQFVTNVDPSWKLDGIADFNGDGHPDIVWRNGAGDTYVWYLVNGAFQSDAFLFSLPPEWVIQGIADFNADGKPDFLMRNTNSGNAFAWFFNNNVAVGDQFLFTIDPVWKVEGVADLNADGQPDLLFRNMSSGLAFTWNTQFSAGNLSLTTSSPAMFGIDPIWEVVQVADWNNDGKPDLLFRNKNTGLVFVWYMNGTTLTTSDFITQIDPSWEIVPRR